VSAAPDVLLVAATQVGRELADRLGAGRCAHEADPYEALTAMSGRHWPAVVIAADQDDFAALCRASRRLQRDSRLLGLCSPAGEPAVRELLGGDGGGGGGPLDDYLIWPPTREELRDLRDIAAATAPPAGAAIEPPHPGSVLAGLLEAACSVPSLEEAVARAVGELLGARVVWADVAEAPAGARLLLAAAPAPRVLVATGSAAVPVGEAGETLRAVRACLPALLAAARRTEDLHRLATTDHLTGAANRRYFYRATDDILRRAGHKQLRATLLLYDIDDFKRYNDTYGHAAGDEILRDTAALMRRTCRSHDLVARIGGDEFAVLFWDDERPRLPDSHPPEAASALADRFRKAVQTHVFPSLGPEARGTLTISGGLANFPRDGQTCVELLRRADLALREAKTSGKNAIYLVGSGLRCGPETPTAPQ